MVCTRVYCAHHDSAARRSSCCSAGPLCCACWASSKCARSRMAMMLLPSRPPASRDCVTARSATVTKRSAPGLPAIKPSCRCSRWPCRPRRRGPSAALREMSMRPLGGPALTITASVPPLASTAAAGGTVSNTAAAQIMRLARMPHSTCV
jgi:hypothetical protein